MRSIQVLRGVAACAVVLCHAKLHPAGAVGVDIFFVISGFIIANVAKGRTAPNFLSDRVWRIYPAYWFASIPWFLVVLWVGGGSADATLSSIALWPIYSSGYALPYLHPGWTLCFEMLFYVGVTLSIALGARVPLAIFALSLVANLVHPTPLLSFLGSPMIFEFLAGAALTRIPLNGRLSAPLVCAAFVLFSLSPYYTRIGVEQPVMRVIGWGIPSFLIVYSLLSMERLFTNWADWFVKLGDASYSIYLWHFGVCIILSGWYATALSLIVGGALYRLIEQPLLSMKARLHQRHATAG